MSPILQATRRSVRGRGPRWTLSISAVCPLRLRVFAFSPGSLLRQRRQGARTQRVDKPIRSLFLALFERATSFRRSSGGQRYASTLAILWQPSGLRSCSVFVRVKSVSNAPDFSGSPLVGLRSKTSLYRYAVPTPTRFYFESVLESAGFFVSSFFGSSFFDSSFFGSSFFSASRSLRSLSRGSTVHLETT